MGSVKEEEFMQAASVPGEKIFVSVRVRPLNEKENARNDVSDWECVNENTIIHRNNLSALEKSMYPTAYTFDRVFGVDCNTRRVYEEGAKHVALSVVSGINSSIFAYGQTSSGKTYTMSGITEHTVADIFDYLEKHKEREFTLKLSALEIYNESVRDLLISDTTPLRLLDDPERGTVVERLTEETLRDWSHFKDLLSVCETQRQIGETTMNEASSRSHQIIKLTIESSALEFLGNGKSSSLSATVNFVDLAGSERASQALSAGTRLKEGCHINRSLLTLGTVIRKLSKGRNGHVPFRDSKLTRILQSSLGGNARTAIICTMSPARPHVEQSRNTLLFASCAKEVSTNAQVNVVMSDKALVKQLQREVARLKNELRSSGSTIVTPDSEALLREKDLQIEKLKKEVADLTMQLEFAQSHIKDLLEVVGEEPPSTASPERLYPKLLVRNAWDSENQSSQSPISSAPYCAESDRSFGASHSSVGHSRRSSDAYFIELSDYEANPRRSSSPRILVKVADHHVPSDAETNVENEVHVDKSEEKKEVDVCESSRDIMSVEEKKMNTFVDSNTLGISTNTFTESNMSSPVATTETSGLTVVETRFKENQYVGSPHFEASKQANSFFKVYVVSSPRRASSGQTQNNICSTRSPIFTKSKSCRESLMRNISPNWFQNEENMDRTPFIIEKESNWKYEDPSFDVLPLKCKSSKERLSRLSSQNSLRCSTVYQDKAQNVENLADRTVTEESRKVDLDSEDQQEGELKPEPCSKSVRDVGVDPMQWHGESSPDWPSEFRRLQREIIELWHACNVSLIHRTYFFLLFNGDQSDSIYMEVELRRLSYLKQTSSDSSQPVEDGGHDTTASSLRNLRRERRMLSKQMQKKLSETERETLYIKWGIALSGKHRRLQLAHKLWSDTANMEHIRDSANLVAKLVGHVEPEQAFKEMFGLNFAPRLTRRKSFAWSGSMKNLLQTSV